MKRWAIITVGLYVLVLLLLTVPVATACFHWGQNAVSLRGIIDWFKEWSYWIWIAVAAAAQALLLLVPVAVSENRPRSRRHLLVPVITTAFLFAWVCISALAAVTAGIWGDKDELFDLFGRNRQILAFFVYLVVAWTVWALVFRRFLVSDEPEALMRRLTRWLIRGSILELLVAVPSHVATRHRHDCCAPAVSFWGIATGITVMLLAFGPGVFFLFVERVRRKTIRSNQA